MELSEEIDFVKQSVEEVKTVMERLEQRLNRAKDAFPDHQIVPAQCYDRSLNPPSG